MANARWSSALHPKSNLKFAGMPSSCFYLPVFLNVPILSAMGTLYSSLIEFGREDRG